jgi:hypothetical protein
VRGADLTRGVENNLGGFWIGLQFATTLFKIMKDLAQERRAE